MMLVLGGALGLAGVLYLADANPAASQSAQLVARPASSDPGTDPANSAWDRAEPLEIPLTGQGASYPTTTGSIRSVEAEALHYDGRLYVRVSWADSTSDDSTLKVEQFSDAVALEFPAQAAATVPSICMGQADAGVNIWQWRADSQTGFGDMAASYPNIWVETYQTDEPAYITAKAAGNPVANADGSPVQNLVSRAFGNIGPAGAQDVTGEGVYANGRWAVVFARDMAGANDSLVSFRDTGKTDMAFAVWDGTAGERNGQKSVSTFVRLSFAGEGGGSQAMTWVLAALVLGVLSAIGVGAAIFGYRRGD
jgi:complex iron-sulfur molybdoenzyme family reductase subunit gamma